MILFSERVLNLVLLDILCLIFQGEMFNMSITNVLHKKFCTYFWITLLSEGSEEAFSLSSVSFCRKRGQPAWVRDMLKRPVWSWYRLFTMFFVFFLAKRARKLRETFLARPLGRDWISSGLFPAMSFISAVLQIWFLSLITRRFVSFNCDKKKRKLSDWPNVGVMRLLCSNATTV